MYGTVPTLCGINSWEYYRIGAYSKCDKSNQKVGPYYFTVGIIPTILNTCWTSTGPTEQDPGEDEDGAALQEHSQHRGGRRGQRQMFLYLWINHSGLRIK
jgi:hypothetical protein